MRHSLVHQLVRKSERALKSARLALDDKDYDNAVNRSYYSMFDIARAALLRAGVIEDKLPRTHAGVNEAFWQHAVRSGQIDRKLAADLSRTESHRIKADYTGIEIGREIAEEAVGRAEVFVQTVERVFSLDESSMAAEYKDNDRSPDDKVSEPNTEPESREPRKIDIPPFSLEEERRKARENWLQIRQQRTQGVSETNSERVATRQHGADMGHSMDDDLGD
jgi:uncharacterized protein (UPF0332 family)